MYSFSAGICSSQMNIYEDYLAGFSGRAGVSFPFPMALHACEDFRVPNGVNKETVHC